MPSINELQSSPFPVADRNYKHWQTRLPEGAHQAVLDFMGAYGMRDRSEALREIVRLFLSWLPEKMEEAGHGSLGAAHEAWKDLDRALYEHEEYKAALTRIRRALSEAATCTDEQKSARIVELSKNAAILSGIPWPLPDIPLIEYDDQYKKLYTRICSLIEHSGDNAITLRTLARSMNEPVSDLMPKLDKLAEEDYIVIETRKTNTRKTLYITVPSIPVSHES